jgi:K+-transporting ATPase A subunit
MFAAMMQYLVFAAVLTTLARPLGGYLERVFSGRPTSLDPVLLPVEAGILRVCEAPKPLISTDGNIDTKRGRTHRRHVDPCA